MDEAREKWNERYRNEGKVFGDDPNQFVRTELEGLSPRRVLDLGCGQGRNAVWLALQGHRVTGLDLSEVAVQQARDLAAGAGVEVDFHAVDLVSAWVPDTEYDLIVLSYLQLPETARREVHRKGVRALAPGGRLFLIAHHRDNLTEGVGGPPLPEVLYDEESLAGDFADLEIRRNQKVFRPVTDPEGVVRRAHDLLLDAAKPT